MKQNDKGTIRIAPYDVYFDNENVFQPDITFVENYNLYKIEENGLQSAPDLVVEVLSPSTANYDRGSEKRYL